MEIGSRSVDSLRIDNVSEGLLFTSRNTSWLGIIKCGICNFCYRMNKIFKLGRLTIRILFLEWVLHRYAAIRGFFTAQIKKNKIKRAIFLKWFLRVPYSDYLDSSI